MRGYLIIAENPNDGHVESLDRSQFRLPSHRSAVDDRRLDLALVRAAPDFEEPFVAPRLVPAVGHQPILGALFDTEADDFDGMSALRR